MKRYKKAWFEINGETYEDDDPREVAIKIIDLALDNSEVYDKLIDVIANNMVEYIDDEDYLAYCYNFQESLNKLNEMKARRFDD